MSRLASTRPRFEFGRSIVLMASISALAAAAPAIALDPFAPPVDDGDVNAPAGGSRGSRSCLVAQSADSFYALSPGDTRIARTQQARPTFRAFVSVAEAKTAVFTLQSADGRVYYRDRTVAVPEGESEIAIELPSEYELKASEQYRWFLEVLCEDELDPNNPVVTGRVERVEPGSRGEEVRARVSSDGWDGDRIGVPVAGDAAGTAAAIAPSDDLEATIARAELYHQDNLWYEALDLLAHARQRHPNAARLEHCWDELLSSAGLVSADEGAR